MILIKNNAQIGSRIAVKLSEMKKYVGFVASYLFITVCIYCVDSSSLLLK